MGQRGRAGDREGKLAWVTAEPQVSQASGQAAQHRRRDKPQLGVCEGHQLEGQSPGWGRGPGQWGWLCFTTVEVGRGGGGEGGQIGVGDCPPAKGNLSWRSQGSVGRVWGSAGPWGREFYGGGKVSQAKVGKSRTCLRWSGAPQGPGSGVKWAPPLN